MSTSEGNKSLIVQFAENLRQIPDDIIEGVLNAMDDEDGKQIINAYAGAFKNQFDTISSLIEAGAGKMSKEMSREAEELLRVTSGVELTRQVKALCSNVKTNVMKIGLAGLIQMIKKIIKWLVTHIFQNLPDWLNSLLDLIDEILHEIFGIGSPKLANILAIKEQNYLAQLTKLAILNREERYLVDNMEEDNL